MPAKFALIGAAGYVAPRHMKAISNPHCELVSERVLRLPMHVDLTESGQLQIVRALGAR